MSERQLLMTLADGPITGDTLSRREGITRAAVWKRIQALRDAGVAIEARPRQGYVLAQPLDLLDSMRIRSQMSAEALALLNQLQVAWSVDSTNAQLLQRPAPASGCEVLLAERQSGGRGRRGRDWVSPLAANLYVSISRQFQGGLARLGGLSLVAGVAVAEALQQANVADIGLKWPNDVLLDGRKLGGLLVEGGGEHAGPARAVIGIGLNVRMPSHMAERITQPWADLTGLAQPISRNALAALLLSHLLPALEAFDKHGLSPFLPRFAAFDALQGQHIDVLHDDGQRTGALALGVAEDGALRVQMGDEERLMYAGEVSIRRT